VYHKTLPTAGAKTARWATVASEAKSLLEAEMQPTRPPPPSLFLLPGTTERLWKNRVGQFQGSV